MTDTTNPQAIMSAAACTAERALKILHTLTDAGFVLVPIEPTPSMVLLGQGEHGNCIGSSPSIDTPSRIYRVMVEAARPEEMDEVKF